MTHSVRVGEGDEALDQRLSDELGGGNAVAMAHAGPQRELTVRIDDELGLAAGISGWTWGVAAGIGMTWVRDDQRSAGLGARLLEAFEMEARSRGAQHVFVTSFTFQAPGFYERHGYVEFARWRDVPVAGQDDVHLRKELGSWLLGERLGQHGQRPFELLVRRTAEPDDQSGQVRSAAVVR